LRMCFHCSRVQWRRALHQSSRRLALLMVILGLTCGCSVIDTHFMKLPTNTYCAELLPEAVWNSMVSVATEERRFLHGTHLSTRQSRSVSLCGLPLRG
jgi:hypothetical protein